MTMIDQTIYMAFYPGLQSNHDVLCGGSIELTADSKQRKTFKIPSTNFSCEYRIVAPKFKYRRQSQLFVWIELTNSVRAYIFKGTDRTNITSIVEKNQSVAIGAPYVVQVDDGIVILANSIYQVAKGNASASFNGTLQISYEVKGELYPWWEKIFMGRSKGAYYTALVGFFLIPLVLFLLIAVFCLSASKKFRKSKKAKKSPEIKSLDIEMKGDKK